MRPARLALNRTDLPLLVGGAFMTVAAAAVSMRTGGSVGVSTLVAVLLFFTVVAGFIAFPHITVAAMIPTFAVLPAVKVLAFPSLGPLKDVITLAAITAMLVLVVQRAGEGHSQRGDFWVAAIVFFLVGLYLVNLGGTLQRDVAWFHGVRLVSQPLLLLLTAMVLPQARRTLRWAMISLVATGAFVALVGVAQQALGADRLIDLGYSYTLQVRYIGDRLRSFGTMDESFAYAGFLLLAIVGLLFWMRRSVPVYAVAALILVGLLFAYVRTSILILLALLGLWLARSRRPTIAAFLLLIAFTVGVAILVWSSGGTETRTVRAGPSLFLTINGRTEGWKLVLERPRTWFVGKGVGEVGTAAERATYDVSRRERDLDDASAVDSGYLALVADVGFIGLVAFLALVARLYLLARTAVLRGLKAGWLAAGFLTVVLLDAVTRDSFTGFPTAFLGLFLVGLALAAAQEEIDAEADAAPAR